MKKTQIINPARKGDNKGLIEITIPSRIVKFEGIEPGDELVLTIERIIKKVE